MTSNERMDMEVRKERERARGKSFKQTDNLEVLYLRPWNNKKKSPLFCRCWLYNLLKFYAFNHMLWIVARGEEISLKLFNFQHRLNEICLNFFFAPWVKIYKEKNCFIMIFIPSHSSRSYIWTLLTAYLTLFISFVCSRDVTIK